MKILHVCPRPSFSGLEAYAFSLALDQKVQGLDVAMMVLKNSPLEKKCLTENLPVVYQFSTAYDLVHLHSTQDLKIALPKLIFSRKRPKIILQTHILISHSKKDPIHFFEYLFVDQMWCSSQPAKKMLEKHIPIANEKIKVVRYGRDVEKIEKEFLSREKARAALDLPSDSIAIGLVSRIDPQKGIKEFLEGAISSLISEPQLHLVFIGGKTEDDPKSWAYSEALEKYHAALDPSLRSRVHFKGNMSNSYQYMLALDIYALPSYKECFALSLLEAQLAGLPVLGTSSGGTPDIVIENKTGFLFEPESSESAGEAIRRALKRQSEWLAFGRAARERIFQEFNFKRISAEIVKRYEGLM